LLADEGTRLGQRGDGLADGRRQLIAFLIYVHRLAPRDPLRQVTATSAAGFSDLLLPETPVAPEAAEGILARLA
jgi:hypothetical protein